MIKNIYNKIFKKYYHNYYCDCCFKKLQDDIVYRNEKAIEYNFFDLCSDCKKDWDNK